MMARFRLLMLADLDYFTVNNIWCGGGPLDV